MNIYALNLTCQRDSALSELMQDTLITYGQPYIKHIRSILTGGREFTRYGNGASWESSMMKLSALSQLIIDMNPKNDDFILSVDSDVVFCSSDLFECVTTKYGIIGVQHKPFFETELGMWGHCSGALIFIRVDIARRMCDLSDDELNRIRFEEFKKYNITENEDVVLSYLAAKCGAVPLDIGGKYTGLNFEEELKTGNLGSYYHLNYCPTEFLGMKVSGKWDLPLVLEAKRITL